MGGEILDWLMDHVMPWVLSALIILVVLMLVVLPFGVYQEMKAEKFSLKKDSWICTNAVERASTTYIQSGNVMVPITSYSKHCTQWSEK